jgi:hypothetical protein
MQVDGRTRLISLDRGPGAGSTAEGQRSVASDDTLPAFQGQAA